MAIIIMPNVLSPMKIVVQGLYWQCFFFPSRLVGCGRSKPLTN